MARNKYHSELNYFDFDESGNVTEKNAEPKEGEKSPSDIENENNYLNANDKDYTEPFRFDDEEKHIQTLVNKDIETDSKIKAISRKLLKGRSFFVREDIDFAEVITGHEFNNRYYVRDSDDNKLMYIKEDSGTFSRMCCGPVRAYNIKFFADDEREVLMKMKRGCVCNICCCVTNNTSYLMEENGNEKEKKIAIFSQGCCIFQPSYQCKSLNSSPSFGFSRGFTLPMFMLRATFEVINCLLFGLVKNFFKDHNLLFLFLICVCVCVCVCVCEFKGLNVN